MKTIKRRTAATAAANKAKAGLRRERQSYRQAQQWRSSPPRGRMDKRISTHVDNSQPSSFIEWRVATTGGVRRGAAGVIRQEGDHQI